MGMDVSEAEFQEKVIELSQTKPVLVDFWAEWCGPCRMLGPVLEKVERELGTFVLVKVNTDQNPGISARYQISGIPAVKLFVNGEVAAEFTGALPEPMVLRFLEEHLPDEALKELLDLAEADPLKAAREALAQGKTRGKATEIFWRASLALLAEGTSNANEELESFLSYIPGSGAPHSEAAQALREFLRTKQEPSKALSKLLENINDSSEHEAALQALLVNMENAPSSDREAPKQEMLLAFQLLGNTSPLVNEYRKKLSRVLF